MKTIPPRLREIFILFSLPGFGNSQSFYRIGVSENGWTDGELALRWIMEDFEPQTRDKAAGKTRVLLLDGHSSHHTVELLEFAIAHNIVILGYPPHCTHALQGLDVVCFARMKEAWKKYIHEFEVLHHRKVKKGDFVELFSKAYVEAFSEETVRAAFKATGIFPYNPDIITEQQMKPSLATSTKATFPLPQPTPVRRVMATFYDHRRTAFELDPDTHATILVGGSASAPQTPPAILDSQIDPELLTPSKRGRILVGALAASKSAPFLVGTSKITSLNKIASPVFEQPPPMSFNEFRWETIGNRKGKGKEKESMTRGELEGAIDQLAERLRIAHINNRAQQSVIEAAHATLVVQNMWAMKLNEALNVKENTKEDDRTKLYPEGKGRHLTSPQFVELRKDMVRKAQDKELEKERKRMLREAKKNRNDAREALWKVWGEEHKQAVEEWERTCAQLRQEGVLVKNLPKKPARPLRADLDEALEDLDDDGDLSDGENDEFGASEDEGTR